MMGSKFNRLMRPCCHAGAGMLICWYCWHPLTALAQHDGENVSAVSATPGPKDTIIQIGDTLEVTVAEDRSFNGYYEVRRGGYFILPFVGRIDAAGLPLKEIEAKVSKALEDTQLPHATVKVDKLAESHGGRWR